MSPNTASRHWASDVASARGVVYSISWSQSVTIKAERFRIVDHCLCVVAEAVCNHLFELPDLESHCVKQFPRLISKLVAEFPRLARRRWLGKGELGATRWRYKERRSSWLYVRPDRFSLPVVVRVLRAVHVLCEIVRYPLRAIDVRADRVYSATV